MKKETKMVLFALPITLILIGVISTILSKNYKGQTYIEEGTENIELKLGYSQSKPSRLIMSDRLNNTEKYDYTMETYRKMRAIGIDKTKNEYLCYEVLHRSYTNIFTGNPRKLPKLMKILDSQNCNKDNQ